MKPRTDITAARWHIGHRRMPPNTIVAAVVGEGTRAHVCSVVRGVDGVDMLLGREWLRLANPRSVRRWTAIPSYGGR